MTILLKIFPAQNGDCFIAEFLVDENKFRLLVDGGTSGSYEALGEYLRALPPDDNVLNLIVVTHIDSDHIGGVLSLLKDQTLSVEIKEVWFNDLQHAMAPDLPLPQVYSVNQGLNLSKKLKEMGVPWNAKLGRKAICLGADNLASTISLGKNADIILLSPSRADLQELVSTWENYVEQKEMVKKPQNKFQVYSSGVDWDGLADSPFDPDKSPTNRSSIAFILDVGGKRIFFGGDASAVTVLNALASVSDCKSVVNTFKVCHHGSSGNTNMALLKKMPAKNYIFSANGKHDHPNLETVARVLKHGGTNPTLIFNYSNLIHTLSDASLKARFPFATEFGDGSKYMEIVIE